jgi:hypothetical protein
VCRVLVAKPEGKRPLWRPTRRWGDNIKVDLQDVGGVDMECIELAQDRDRWRALINAFIFIIMLCIVWMTLRKGEDTHI